ncbi:retrovirus-related pol polyprotein from transposon TNT 1-94 [Tanacetum coccineum]
MDWGREGGGGWKGLCRLKEWYWRERRIGGKVCGWDGRVGCYWGDRVDCEKCHDNDDNLELFLSFCFWHYLAFIWQNPGSKKKPHKPKFKDTNQEKLYLLHMDLCGQMRVASVNGKKIYNGTEFVNQTLREYYEKVSIFHETSVARSPQQNGVAERRNHTLIEAARTMLICAKAPLFLWAEAVATAFDQDAPSPSNSQTTPETQPPVIPNGVKEDNHDIKVAHMGNDPYFGIPIPEIPSDQSSSSDSIHTIVHPYHQISEHNSKWTKDHPLENIIGELDRPVSTWLQLHEQALFCYYDAFLTAVEPKTYKDALT